MTTPSTPQPRSHIRDIPAYVPGKPPTPRPDLVTYKLSSNENPYPPADAVVEALARCDARKLRLYPDPVSRDLCAAAATASCSTA